MGKIAAQWPLLAAFFSGAVLVAAFAPFSLGWLAPLPLVVLFCLWQVAGNPRRALLLGWSFGFGCMSFGLFWLHHSIGQFGGLSTPVAMLIALLFAAGIALFPALAGYLSWRLPLLGNYRLLAFAALWVITEWLRSWLLTGFTWLTLGYSQIDTPLAGFGPLLGVYGISLLLGLSAVFICQRQKKSLLALTIMWLAGWGLQQVQWTHTQHQAVPVAMVQGNIPQERKWLSSEFLPTLDVYQKLTAEHPEAKLLIWPETAVPAFADQVERPFLAPLHEKFSAEKRDLLLGIPYRQDERHYFNAMIALGQSGRERYFKRHLVPFGEYMPFEQLLKPLIEMLAIPMSAFTPGQAPRPLMHVAGHAVGISICYEDTFGDEVRQSLPEAAFLVNASNDAWFGDSLAPHQHLQMARMRALENGRYLLRATNTGISAIIDEQGQLQQLLPLFQRGVLAGRVQPRQGSTPFVVWGNAGALLLSLLLLAWGIWRSKGVG